MSESIDIDITEWVDFVKTLDGADKLLAKHIKAGLYSSLFLINQWQSEKTPVGVTGNLKGAWSIDIKGQGVNLRGETVNPLIYALPREKGRDPGRMPPVEPIALWLKRVKGLSGDELTAAAWALARHIGKYGTTGAYMNEQAYQRAIQGNEIEKIFEDELEQFLKELAR